MALRKYIDVLINADGTAKTKEPLYVFHRDRNLELYFKLIDYKYKYSKGTVSEDILNMIYTLEGTSAWITLISPTGAEIERGNGVTLDNVIVEKSYVKFILTEDLTDEITEIGTYKLQIHIVDDVGGEFTIPPINFEVKERVKGTLQPNGVELLTDENNNLNTESGINIMASGTGVKISDLPLRATMNGQEHFPVVINGITYKMPTSQVAKASHTHTEYANKTHSHTKSEITDFPTIPSKTSQLTNDSTFASESFVTTKIAEAQLGGGSGNIDLSGYATKEELATKSNVGHTHNEYLTEHQDISGKVDKVPGKSLILDTEITKLNGITDSKITKWDTAYNHSTSTHAPSTAQKNSDITKAEIEAKLTGEVSSHTHNYEPVIAMKGTAFNKNFGTGVGEVAEGNHGHTGYASTGQVEANATQIAEITQQVNDHIQNHPSVGGNVNSIDFTETTSPSTMSPMITFIDDDGKSDVMTKLFPIFKSRGLKSSCAIITSLIDTRSNVFEGGTAKFLTTDNLIELADEGWEILSHGSYYASNMTNFITDEDLSDALNKKSKQMLENKGIKVNGFVYPQNNMETRVYNKVKEYYTFALGGLDISNTISTDIYKLNRIAFGCYTSTNKTILGNNEKKTLAYYKKCVDYCKANNCWIIFMMHVADTFDTTANNPTNSEAIKDILPQLLDYIVEQKVDVVTPSQGYAKLYDNNFLKKPIEIQKKVKLTDVNANTIGSINFANNIYMEDGVTTLADEIKKIKQLIKNSNYIEPVAITLDNTNKNIILGNKLNLNAIVTPYDTTNKDIYWTTSNAEIATVTQKGVVTALKAGDVIITATTVSKGLSAKCNITVTSQPTNVTGVKLNTNSLEVKMTKTASLTAIIEPSNVFDNTVAWSVNNSNCTISQNGLSCTITGAIEGTSIVTVTTTDGGYKDTCNITITPNTSSNSFPYEAYIQTLLDSRNYVSGNILNDSVGICNVTTQTTPTKNGNYISLLNTSKARSNISPLKNITNEYSIAFAYKVTTNARIMLLEHQIKGQPYAGFSNTLDALKCTYELIRSTTGNKASYQNMISLGTVIKGIITVDVNSVNLYINGTLVKTSTVTENVVPLDETILAIGCTAMDSEGMNGAMDFGCYVTYNKALNATEAQEVYDYMNTVWI